MATEKRLIDVNPLIERYSGGDELKSMSESLHDSIFVEVLRNAPTVDAVPVDEIKFHHILIDENGVPEVKLQLGERILVLHTDPVDVAQVVRCKNCFADGCCSVQIDLNMGGEGYCPKGKRRNDHG